MNKNDIEKYLRMLGQELHQQGLIFDIILLGGAVMLIEVGNRDSTQDIDTYFLPDFVAIFKAAAIVAGREGLPDGWLNDAAAGSTYFFKKSPSTKLWKKFPGLNVYIASLDYLLVTKLMAVRLKDEPDILALSKKLHISKRKDALALLKNYVPKEYISEEVLDEIDELFEA